MPKCNACGKETHIDLLDAKPGTPEKVIPNAPNWERLECWACYGPGYAVNDRRMLKADSPQMKASEPR